MAGRSATFETAGSDRWSSGVLSSSPAIADIITDLNRCGLSARPIGMNLQKKSTDGSKTDQPRFLFSDIAAAAARNGESTPPADVFRAAPARWERTRDNDCIIFFSSINFAV
jgi:hypothetical protein